MPNHPFVETHHIAGVAEDGGLTDLDNGVLLCNFHHHELHRKRWQIIRHGSQLTFYDPEPAASDPPARQARHPDHTPMLRCCHTRHTRPNRHQTSGPIRVAATAAANTSPPCALDELLHHLTAA